MNKTILFFAILSVSCLMPFACSFSQGAAINTTGAAADSSAILDLSSSDRGFLIPRVALTDTALALPLVNPANSLLIYNTAAITGGSPGFYYWNDSKTQWIKLITSENSGWELSGNQDTDSLNNFLGTRDAQALIFKTNNIERMHLSKNGDLGIGVVNPTEDLDISGKAKIRGGVSGITLSEPESVSTVEWAVCFDQLPGAVGSTQTMVLSYYLAFGACTGKIYIDNVWVSYFGPCNGADPVGLYTYTMTYTKPAGTKSVKIAYNEAVPGCQQCGTSKNTVLIFR